MRKKGNKKDKQIAEFQRKDRQYTERGTWVGKLWITNERSNGDSEEKLLGEGER